MMISPNTPECGKSLSGFLLHEGNILNEPVIQQSNEARRHLFQFEYSICTLYPSEEH